MHRYEIGQPYSPTRSSWPEAVDYNYRGRTHELRLFLARPSAFEVGAIQHGPCRFALYADGPLLLLLYQFGGAIPWSDAPMSLWLVPEEERLPPPRGLAADQRALLQVVLVDAGTGIVRALRIVSWSPTFTAAIHAAILDQLATPFPGQAAYDRALAMLYARYPTTGDLLRAASAKTDGGA